MSPLLCTEGRHNNNFHDSACKSKADNNQYKANRQYLLILQCSICLLLASRISPLNFDVKQVFRDNRDNINRDNIRSSIPGYVECRTIFFWAIQFPGDLPDPHPLLITVSQQTQNICKTLNLKQRRPNVFVPHMLCK